ncbi:MAG: InlB B-repeat-containing protein, partial [Treponema sp.]|nr:InlB B-repeat-containing protein [Treponema sp.]
MKNKYAVFTVLILLCFCITACGNPIMEKWWDEHSGEERAVPPKSTVFHLVEFRPDGGLPAPGPQYIAHGGKLAKILPMSKDHYAFGGWYTDTAFSPGKEFDLTTDTVKNNLILYAKWVPVYNFKVTFVANGGSPPPPPQSLYTGTKAIEPPPMIRIGYGFGGWYTNPTFTTEYNFNANVTQDLTLYAKWQKLETSYYTVIFDPDGGFPPPVDQRVIADGTGKLVEPMAMTKAGYGFAGWWYMDVGLEYQWNFISSNLVDK